MEAFCWICPVCNRDTTITDSNTSSGSDYLTIPNKRGSKILFIRWIVCPNVKCKEFTLTVWLHDYIYDRNRGEYTIGKRLNIWRLVPLSDAKVFPDYVPEAIRNDYKEACLIKDLSPKASASLSRRCLQGMIRDFWKIKKRNLKLEIDALEGKVDKTTWKAIHSVRSVGNIGAHMEKDINLVIDVEPDEAELLIKLIEKLIEKWYVHRYEEDEMMQDVIALKEEKEAEKKEKQETQQSAEKTPGG